MSAFTGWLEHVGLGAVFALVLVEQIGLPLPSYPLLIIAGAWSMQGGAAPARIVGVAVAACLVADTAWYFTGFRFGSRVLRTMCGLAVVPDSCVADTERLFSRYGTRMLVVAKFIPALGAVSTAMAGVVGAALAGFLFYDLVGSLLWAASGVALGAVFHGAVDDVFRTLAQLGHAGLWLIGLALAAFMAYKMWRRQRFFQELRMARISVPELVRLIEEGPEPLIVDARSPAARARDGMIPRAVAFEALDRSGHTGDVVVYCACPNEATAARIAKQLKAAGFSRVRPLEGGIHAWADAGLAIFRG